jgi:two-component system cell cycle response regulator
MPRLILVVDDDSAVREHISAGLRCAGYDVQMADNGEQAVEKAHACPPSLIVLDMVMPVMDGWTFCARQRYDQTLAHIPVVLISMVPPELLTNVPAVGALQKPIDEDALLSLILAHVGAESARARCGG